MLDSLRFAPVAHADVAEITTLAHAVQWPHRWEDIDLLVSLGYGLILRTSVTDEAIAVGMWWPFGAHHARLGMIIVRPDCQGRGLGRALVKELVEANAGRSLALLATVSGKQLYESLGFRSVGTTLQVQGDLIPAPVHTHISDVREIPASDLPEIVQYDKEVTGMDRAQMMSALALVGRVAIHEAGGYAIERPFGRGSVIGPIVSETEEAAIELFDALARPGFVRVDCVSNATILHDHLIRRGLKPLSDVTEVMLRGEVPFNNVANKKWALSSHALG